jgi:hypothetical protein
MAVTEQQVVALELERVTPKVRRVFEQDRKFYNAIQNKDVEKVSNREMRVPLEIAPGGNFGYFDPNGGDLGRGGGPVWDKATLQPVYMAENTEYTKLAQWATDSDRKSVENAVRKMVAGQMDELKRQLDAQLMQNGTGAIGTITGVTAAATQDTYTFTTDGFGVRLMRQGQTIQVFDSTLATNRGSATIISWDVANKTIVVQPAISGSTGGDRIVTRGIAAPASLPALFGVPYQHSNASTGTWLGFNRATTPQIRATGINASSSALSLPLPRLAINGIGNRVGEDNNFNPSAWMHPAQKQAYEEIGQLVSIIQKAPNDEKLNMYFDRMQMAGAEVRTSFNWDMTRIDFVSDGVWGRGEILPIGFYKTDGMNILEILGASGGVATADIFYMCIGTQIFVNNPAACAYIYSLSVPSGY